MMNSLPSGYTLLEYIESSGSQYINTGITPNQNTRVLCEVDFEAVSSAAWLFGARNGTAINAYGFLSVQNEYRSDYGSSYTGQEIPDAYSGKTEIDKNGNLTRINGELKKTANKENFSCSVSIFVFANNNDGSVSGYSKAKVYSFKIYQNGADLSRDFIPCKNQSGVIGLYDAVSGKFYGNSGSGSFIAGPEMVVPDSPGYISQVTAAVLIWPPVKCEGYKVYKNGVLISSVKDTQFIDTSVYDGQEIEYKVSAYNGNLESPAIATLVTIKEGYTTLLPVITSAFFQ